MSPKDQEDCNEYAMRGLYDLHMKGIFPNSKFFDWLDELGGIGIVNKLTDYAINNGWKIFTRRMFYVEGLTAHDNYTVMCNHKSSNNLWIPKFITTTRRSFEEDLNNAYKTISIAEKLPEYVIEFKVRNYDERFKFETI